MLFATRLLHTGGPITQDSALDAWESLQWHAQQLQKSCNALGASLYPPQEADEVAGEAEAVYNSCCLLLDEFPEQYATAEETRQRLAALQTVLDAAQEALSAALQAARKEGSKAKALEGEEEEEGEEEDN